MSNLHTTATMAAKTNTIRRVTKATGLALAIAVLASACSADRPELGSVDTTESTLVVPVNESTSIVGPGDRAAQPMRAISAVDSLVVFQAPGSDIVTHELAARTDFGSATVLLVEEVAADGWVRVQLPVRPNGTSGWVRMSDVQLELLDTVVQVDLEARTLATWVDGELTSLSSVAVGSVENPTPTGTFFVTDKIDTVNDGGAYGPYALGLSAHSETLTEFAGGDGQIGIHGTNDPSSIGEAVSHGCVRLPNDLIELLATELPLGTPVVIS